MIQDSPTIEELYNILRENPTKWYASTSFSNRNQKTSDKLKRLYKQGYAERIQRRIGFHMVYHYRIK